MKNCDLMVKNRAEKPVCTLAFKFLAITMERSWARNTYLTGVFPRTEFSPSQTAASAATYCAITLQIQGRLIDG